MRLLSGDWFNNFSFEEKAFLWIALTLLLLAMGMIIFLLANRFIKGYVSKTRAIKLEFFQQATNAIIIGESNATMPAASYQFYLGKLFQVFGKNESSKQLLIDHLIAMKKNVSGSTASAIDKLFIDLDLPNYCLEKLKSQSWSKKAKAIRELAELNYLPAIETIKPLVNHRNQTLKEEAFIALVRLDPNSSLDFLDDYEEPITSWMRINIHQHLVKKDARKLPLFSKWFDSKNRDVTLFAISMARVFRQVEAAKSLVHLINHHNHVVVASAIRALGELDAHEEVDSIINVYQRYWDSEKISICIIRCIERIGSSREHLLVLKSYLKHPLHTIRFESALALAKFGAAGEDILNASNQEDNGTLAKIIDHIHEPLLQ